MCTAGRKSVCLSDSAYPAALAALWRLTDRAAGGTIFVCVLMAQNHSYSGCLPTYGAKHSVMLKVFTERDAAR